MSENEHTGQLLPAKFSWTHGIELVEDRFPPASKQIVPLASSLQYLKSERSNTMKLESYFAAAASQAEQTQMDIIANNLANANTPGYKKDILSFSALLGEIEHTDMSQGPIRTTGDKLDVALSGSGFLSVKTNHGILYTRAGDLAVNGSKQLVTQDGWPVLGKNGSPIEVNDVSQLRITSNGQIFDGNNAVNQLGLVDFPPNSLQKVGGGYFQPENANVQPQQANNCTVRQGALEQANFNPVQQIAKMIVATRNFEAYQKTLQDASNLDSQLITKTSG